MVRSGPGREGDLHHWCSGKECRGISLEYEGCHGPFPWYASLHIQKKKKKIKIKMFYIAEKRKTKIITV